MIASLSKSHLVLQLFVFILISVHLISDFIMMGPSMILYIACLSPLSWNSSQIHSIFGEFFFFLDFMCPLKEYISILYFKYLVMPTMSVFKWASISAHFSFQHSFFACMHLSCVCLTSYILCQFLVLSTVSFSIMLKKLNVIHFFFLAFHILGCTLLPMSIILLLKYNTLSY